MAEKIDIEKSKDICAARHVIGVIDNVKTPMLMYDFEKDIVKKALYAYINSIEKD